MTHSLYDRAGALLRPEQFFEPAGIANDLGLVPAVSGIYGWWFDAAPSGVADNGALECGGRKLLYVGICPNGSNPRSKRTLRQRMKEHCRGPIRTSTLRRTLTALLRDELGLMVSRTAAGKRVLLGEGEALLSQWMARHMRVAWMADPAPWLIEAELIRTIVLPLNIMGSPDTGAAALRRKRGAL